MQRIGRLYGVQELELIKVGFYRTILTLDPNPYYLVFTSPEIHYL